MFGVRESAVTLDAPCADAAGPGRRSAYGISGARPGQTLWRVSSGTGSEDVEGLKILPQENSVVAETRMPDLFYSRLPELSVADGTPIEQVYSEDDNLEAVFKYLVNK